MSSSNAAKTWLITGCSSGLGRALAGRVLARGDRLVASARDPGSVLDLVRAFPDRCRPLALDVTDSARVGQAVDEAAGMFAGLDVVVNNAGYGLIGALEEVSEDQIRRCLDTNFLGALRVIRAALPILRGQRRGHFVNVSAAAAISNYPGFSIYGAAKCALESVSESLAAECRPLGIKVTIVQPGPFRTDFISRSLERAPEAIPDYDASSGKFLRLIQGMDGRQPGDPLRAAESVIAAVCSENPPLRLVLGKYAVSKARQRRATLDRELDAWEAIGLPTDYAPGAP